MLDEALGFMARCLLLATISQFTPVWPTRAETVEEIATPAGPLVVDATNNQTFSREFKIILGGQTVLHTIEGGSGAPFLNFPEPTVIRYVAEPIGPFDAVAVFQQFSSGNACNGGPIWFLGIRKDGRFTVSSQIDFCGGLSPEIWIDHGVIHVKLPVDEKERLPRDARNPLPEEWAYSGQGLTRIR
jgi:hypothetical protein